MHLYPGQLVYIMAENKIGIYLAYERGKYRYEEPTVYVFRLSGKDGATSDTYVYEFNEITPISIPDKTSVTGQITLQTPWQRDSLTAFIGDKTLETMRSTIIKFCNKLVRDFSADKVLNIKYPINMEDAATKADKALAAVTTPEVDTLPDVEDKRSEREKALEKYYEHLQHD